METMVNWLYCDGDAGAGGCVVMLDHNDVESRHRGPRRDRPANR